MIFSRQTNQMTKIWLKLNVILGQRLRLRRNQNLGSKWTVVRGGTGGVGCDWSARPVIFRWACRCRSVSRGSGSSPRKLLRSVATSLWWKSLEEKSMSAPLLSCSLSICCLRLFPGTRNRPSTCRSARQQPALYFVMNSTKAKYSWILNTKDTVKFSLAIFCKQIFQ